MVLNAIGDQKEEDFWTVMIHRLYRQSLRLLDADVATATKFLQMSLRNVSSLDGASGAIWVVIDELTLNLGCYTWSAVGEEASRDKRWTKQGSTKVD